MNIASHTPGPWIFPSHGRTVDAVLANGRYVALCEVYSGAANSIPEADANQRLIAAAPDMIAAVKHAVKVLRRAHTVAENNSRPIAAAYFLEEIAVLEAVVFKAEGGR